MRSASGLPTTPAAAAVLTGNVALLIFGELAHTTTPQACLPTTCRLLFFATGSDRVPVKGLGQLQPPFTISKAGPHSDRLPSAHTCFHHVISPDYKIACLVPVAGCTLVLCCCLEPGLQSLHLCTLCWSLQDKEYLQQRLLLAIKNSTGSGMIWHCRTLIPPQPTFEPACLDRSALCTQGQLKCLLICLVLIPAFSNVTATRCPLPSALIPDSLEAPP